MSEAEKVTLYNVLSGVRVIELASVLAGPSVGMFCAELGADVIKIENPKTDGDMTRSWKMPSEKDADISAYFSSVNWGKRSVTLDLTKEEDRTICHILCEKADIVLVSYKSGDAEKYGVDYEALRKKNPALIYAAVTGFGEHDNRVAFDAVLQAMTGFMSMNGLPETPPIKMPVALIDVLAGHHIKEALLLALLKREKTGKGSAFSVSLYGAGITSLVNQAANYLIAGAIPQRIGSEHPNIVPYGHVFLTKDKKYLLLAIGTDKQFSHLCSILHIPEIATDERFSTNTARVTNRALVNTILQEKIELTEGDILENKCVQMEIPCAIVRSVAEALDSPYAQQFLFEDNGLRGVRSLVFEEYNNTKPQLKRPPHLGEHNEEVIGKKEINQ